MAAGLLPLGLGRVAKGRNFAAQGPDVLTDMSCVLLQGAADDWHAIRDWVDCSGAVPIDALEHSFGGASVWVTDTARQAPSYPRFFKCRGFAHRRLAFPSERDRFEVPIAMTHLDRHT